MPIVAKESGGFMLCCATKHPEEDTMRRASSQYGLLSSSGGLSPVLACYWCNVCGYVEFYIPQEYRT